MRLEKTKTSKGNEKYEEKRIGRGDKREKKGRKRREIKMGEAE